MKASPEHNRSRILKLEAIVARLAARVELLERHVERLIEDQPSPDSNDCGPWLERIVVGGKP